MSQSYRPEDFVHEVESQYLTIEAATFWACEPLLRRFLAEGVAERWLTEQLRHLGGSEDDLGAWQAKDTQVYRGEGWQLSLAVLDTPLRFIHLAPYLAFYAPLKGELTVDRYRLPPRFRKDVFDPNMRLDRPERFTIPAREIVRLDSTQFAYDFQISEPVPVVRFTSRHLHTLQWLFSKATLQAWQANDADIHFTQLRVAAQVLGKIAHQSSLEPLLKLSHHPHHAVRWAAIQNLGRISRTAAFARVREAVADSHPHVSRAAERTLRQLAPAQDGK